VSTQLMKGWRQLAPRPERSEPSELEQAMQMESPEQDQSFQKELPGHEINCASYLRYTAYCPQLAEVLRPMLPQFLVTGLYLVGLT